MTDLLPKTITPEIFQFLLIGAGIQLLVWLLFAWTIARTLRLIAKENQCILPSQAWFLAMPFFNIYWNFEVTRRLTDSLNNEFFDRKIPVDDNPTRKWGMLNAWTFLLMNIPLPSVFLVSLRVVNLVYFVTYWIKINQYRVLLVEHNKFREINDISENKEES